MRVARVSDRLSVLFGDGAVDVELVSGGRFAADPDAVFERWDEFREWAGGPLGPAIVTTDEVGDPDDLELSCSIDDEVLQKARTRDMVFAVPELVARLSAVCPLLPGDLIFTGTPPGVGMARSPQRFLAPGTALVSTIENVGELRNPLVSG